MTTRHNGEIVDRAYSPRDREDSNVLANLRQSQIAEFCKSEPRQVLTSGAASMFSRKIELALRIGQWERIDELLAQARAVIEGRDKNFSVPAEDTPMCDLVPLRVANALEENLGVIFAGQAVGLSDADLMAIHFFSGKPIEQLDKGLAKVGLRRAGKMAAASPAGLG